MTSRSYFGKMNSTLGSVVPLAMFQIIFAINTFRETGVHRIKFHVPEKTETIKLVKF